MMRTLRVGLGERSYDVFVGAGLIGQAGALMKPLLPRGRTTVVCDKTVRRLHGAALEAALEAQGIASSWIVLPPGEQTKSWAGLAELSEQLLTLGLDRGDAITALGGGVIGDLTGFAAAIYKRGIDFIQIPTTLLAQVDSSVGGKTAIDTPQGKNLIGAFHQPRLVLADLDVLATLPGREMRAGYAEVIKYGLLGDFDFFQWLEANGAAVLDRRPDALGQAVAHAIAMKAQIVGDDEKEAAGRALLNLGHTFGHALESETGFGEALLHGEGVAVGCAQAFRFSAMLGHCTAQDAARAESGIAAAGLPTRMAQVSGAPFPATRLIEHMAQDKKAEGGRLTFVLAKGIGQAFVAKGVDADAVRAFLISEGAIAASESA
jgi:3-dehydroquinate synthase